MKSINFLLVLALATGCVFAAENGGPRGKGRAVAHVVNIQQSGMNMGTPTHPGGAATFVYHDGVTNVPSLTNLETGSDPRTACNAGANAWPAVSTVGFTDGGTTTTSTVNNSDGVNLVTFVNNATNNAAAGSALAVTLTSYSTTTFVISDCDIVWNSSVMFSTLGSPTHYDIQSVAAHEFGHAFGLNHSGVCSATMFPFSGLGATHQRSLSVDDVAGVNGVYQTVPNFWSTGVISGTITKSASNLYGAHVVARSMVDGVTYASAISKPDGTYLLSGLPQGPYVVYAEPLDGPVGDSNITSSFYTTGKDVSFGTTYFGGNASPTIVRVRETMVTSSIDIAVDPNAPTYNLNLVGDFPTGMGSFSVSSSGYELAPGTTTFTVVAGPNVDMISDAFFSMSGQGVTFGPNSTASGTLSPGVGFKVFQTVIAADAEPGPRDIIVNDGTDVGVYCGVIDISTGGSAATSFAFGTASTGTSGQPVLAGNGGNPSIGNTSFQLDVTNGVNGETCYYFGAAKPDYIDMGNGVVQWLSIPNHDLFPTAGYSASVVGGVATLPAPIPNNPQLAGLRVYFQAALSDAAAMGGLSSTQGLVLVINP